MTVTAASGPAPDTTRPDDTRSRVLGVALELVVDKGFAATSTREVCEQMGFTKAALWYHFRSKDDLLAALLAPVDDALSALVDTSGSRRALLVGYVDLVARHADLIRVLYDDPSVRGNPVTATVRACYGRLVDLLAAAPEADLRSRGRARAALGAVHAVLLRGDPCEDRDLLHETAVVAACGALGTPAPRRS